MYWMLFVILVIAIAVLSVYIVLTIVKDFCSSKNVGIKKTGARKKLVSHNSDIEDLTNIEVDLTRLAPRVSLVNKVDVDTVRLLLRLNSRKDSRDVPTRPSLESIQSSVVGKSEVDFSKSIDNLEYWDPTSLEVLKKITSIEMNANKLKEYMTGFLGHLSDLQYYDISEKFIRLQIELCDINCDREDLRSRKADVFMHIKKCQDDLRAGKQLEN